MTKSPYEAREKARWITENASRFIRPDAARFYAPGTKLEDVFPALALKYSPNQPRVPAGHSDGGQWTSGSGGRPRVIIDTTDWDNESDLSGEDVGATGEAFDGADYNPGFDGPARGDLNDNGSGRPTGITDPRVISDADPEVVRPGEQYAQARGGRGRGGGSDLTPGQAAQLAIAKSRAQDAIARVREVDRDWNPTPSVSRTTDGLIRAYEAEAVQAQARMSELAMQRFAPGTFTGEAIVSSGASRPTTAERQEINRIGRETGCHSCGTKDSGRPDGNFNVDHQPPTALNWSGVPQRLYPHCVACSGKQGWSVMMFLKGEK